MERSAEPSLIAASHPLVTDYWFSRRTRPRAPIVQTSQKNSLQSTVIQYFAHGRPLVQDYNPVSGLPRSSAISDSKRFHIQNFYWQSVCRFNIRTVSNVRWHRIRL